MRPVAFPKNPQKRRKKDSGKLAICPDHPRRRTEVKVCMPGGLRCVVLYFKFYENRSIGFAAVGGRKSPFPITLVSGLYNSLYYRTSRDRPTLHHLERMLMFEMTTVITHTHFSKQANKQGSRRPTWSIERRYFQ